MSVGSRLQELWRQLDRPGVRGAVFSTGWLAGERVLRLGLGAIVGVWIARVLGPDRYGQLSYALALATIVGAGANLGTDWVVVRELVSRPERSRAILDTATGIRLAGALVSTVLAVAIAAALHRSDPAMLALVLVFASTTLFKPIDVVDLWCQARTELRPAIWARNTGFVAGLAMRVTVVLAGGSLVALAAAEPVGAAVGAILLVVIFRRHGFHLGIEHWDAAEARALMRASWPLLFAGLAIVVYTRIDQVMLERLGGEDSTQVGLYAAALRLSEVWYFVPMAIVTAVFPHIVTSKKEGQAVYLARLGRLFGLMSAIALAVAIPTTFVSPWVIGLLYGPRFAAAAPILSIHIWTTLFVFWGVVGETWYLNEGLTHLSLWRTLAAAAVNVALNLVWIPRYGGLGAAVATLVAQLCAGWLFNLADARTRPIFALQARSLLLKGVLW